MMALEQDRERAHINEQMKYFTGTIQVIPMGMTSERFANSRLTYIESTKRGAKRAQSTRKLKERLNHANHTTQIKQR